MKAKIRRGVLLLCALSLLCTVCRAAQQTHCAYLFGFPDGSVRPLDSLTREQLAQILARLLPEADAARCAFLDVPQTRWSYRAVCTVCALGIYSEAESAYFQPQTEVSGREFSDALHRAAMYLPLLAEAENSSDPTPISRAQAVRTLNALLGRCTDAGMEGMLLWSDNRDSGAWYFADLQEAGNSHTCENGHWCGLG